MPLFSLSYVTCAVWGCDNPPAIHDGHWCSWHVATTNGDVPFAALRRAGEDDGQRDGGDDDRHTDEQDDGTVREGRPTHG